MGVVYLARDLRLDRKVAVKVMAPEVAGDRAFRDRFEREARMAAATDHPNIIPIYDTGEQDGVLYLAMRFVPGTDLRTLLVETGALPSDRAVGILRQVAGALDAAHEQGIVHRDVKPANILLASGSGSDETDHVYLTDFGLTKRFAQASRALTASGQFVGTIDYVAPEQVEGQAVDGRADQYSLACVMFECLTGAVVFGETSDVATLFAHVQQPPPPVTSLRPDLPVEVDEVLAQALAKSPGDRFASCLEFVAAMREALGAWGVPVVRPAGRTPERPVAAPPPPPFPGIGSARPTDAPLEMPASPGTSPPDTGATAEAPPVAPPAPVARPSTPPPPGAGGKARPAPEAPPSRPPPGDGAPARPRRPGRALVLAGAAVVVVAGAVIAWFALNGGGGTPDGDGTTTSPPVGLQLDWRQRPQDALGGSGLQEIGAVTMVARPGPQGNTVAAAGSAVVAGGADADAAVWLSHDGLTWSLAPGEPGLATPGPQVIQGVSGGGRGRLVAVGSDGPPASEDAAVWLSDDGGENWSRVTGSQRQLGGSGAQSMSRVAGTRVGLLAAGFDTDPVDGKDGAVWISKNGKSWTEITGGDLGGQGEQKVKRIAKRPGTTGFVAAGYDTSPGKGTDAAIWLSDDGRHWSQVGSPDLVGRAGNQTMNDIQEVGDQLVAVGFDDAAGDGRDAAIWISSNGTKWTEVTGGALAGAGDQVLTRVYPTGSTRRGFPKLVGGGFVVVNGDQNAVIWYSDDGRTWTRETSSQDQLGGPGAQAVGSIVAVDHGFPLVAVGSDGSGKDGDAAVWAAEGPTPK